METTLFNLPTTHDQSRGHPTDRTDTTAEPAAADLRLHYVGLAHFFAAFEPPPRARAPREPALKSAPRSAP